MTTVKDIRELFSDNWLVLVDEEDTDIYIERTCSERDISEFDKCEVKAAYTSSGSEFVEIICQIDSKDPSLPKKRRYEFNGTWTYVVEANSFKEARSIFDGVCIEELYIHDDYDVTEIED